MFDPAHRATFLLVCLALSFSSCSHPDTIRQMSGNTWGTTYHITYTAPENLAGSILAQMEAIDSTLSMFATDSEVSRINKSQSPIRVSQTFQDVFNVSRKVNTLSDGAFDPTVAPLVDLWGFGRKGDTIPIPDSITISHTLSRVGISHCHIDGDNMLHKGHPATEFDFSAVAKGYGVDMIADALTRARVHNYMIEIGGEISLKGLNPRGEKWHIQIDAPVTADSLTHSRLTLLAITDCCIATSGNYRRWRDTDQGRVSHTISPTTGRPVASPTLSATVITPSCAMADALATACMAMPPDSALRMIDNLPGVAAMLVVAADDVQFRIITTHDWPANP